MQLDVEESTPASYMTFDFTPELQYELAKFCHHAITWKFYYSLLYEAWLEHLWLTPLGSKFNWDNQGVFFPPINTVQYTL